MVGRRYQRLLEEGKDLPDLVLIDGGKGQLGAAVSALEELGLGDQPVVSLAKREELIFVRGREEPIALPHSSPVLQLVQRVRDEAHRFAIGFHRQVRSGRTIRSELDDVPGIGPAKRRKLLSVFGSVRGVRGATEAELAAVVGKAMAARLRAHSRRDERAGRTLASGLHLRPLAVGLRALQDGGDEREAETPSSTVGWSAFGSASPATCGADRLEGLAVDVGEGLDEALGVARRACRMYSFAMSHTRSAFPRESRVWKPSRVLQDQVVRLLLPPLQALLRAVDADVEAVLLARGDLRRVEDAPGAALEVQQHHRVVVEPVARDEAMRSAQSSSTSSPVT